MQTEINFVLGNYGGPNKLSNSVRQAGHVAVSINKIVLTCK